MTKKITIIALASIAAFTFCGKKEIKHFEHQGFAGWKSVKNIEITKVPKGDSITITSKAKKPSAGSTTHGAYLTIPAQIAEPFSERLIKITFSAKKGEKNGSENIWAAYSTAEVGNSGWNKFQLMKDFKEYSFEYEVPAMNKGSIDYIGFNSDLAGTGKTAVISNVKVEVVTIDDF